MRHSKGTVVLYCCARIILATASFVNCRCTYIVRNKENPDPAQMLEVGQTKILSYLL